MTELDAILAELAAVAEQLATVPDDARSERATLQRRRAELHAAARALDPADSAGLRAELSRLEARWDELQQQRIDVVKQAGDLAAGNFGFTSDAVRINQRIDAAGGRREIEDRIAHLRARLRELEEGG